MQPHSLLQSCTLRHVRTWCKLVERRRGLSALQHADGRAGDVLFHHASHRYVRDWREGRATTRITFVQREDNARANGVACQVIVLVPLLFAPGQRPAWVVEDQIGWANGDV